VVGDGDDWGTYLPHDGPPDLASLGGSTLGGSTLGGSTLGGSTLGGSALGDGDGAVWAVSEDNALYVSADGASFHELPAR
jgi:hypothetical protein